MDMQYGCPMFGGGWAVMLFAILFGFLLLVGVVLIAVWLASRYRPPGGAVGAAETPLDILKKRYARGEISQDEFERMKQELS